MVAPIIPIGAAVAKLVVKHGLPAVQKAVKAQKTKSARKSRETQTASKSQTAKENIKQGLADPKAPPAKRGPSGMYSSKDILNDGARGRTSISARKLSVPSKPKGKGK